MYDGLDRVPIKNMSFKQLRERVQMLQDRYDVLIRRYPELRGMGGGGESGEGVDWANIITPLIRATVNRIQFRASLNSSSAIEIFARPENGKAPLSEGGEAEELDHTAVYRYNGEDAVEYWYWNGNEWRCSLGGFSSEFNQTPAGFQMDGTLEIKTDTDGRVTVSDSFIKMYPEVDGAPTYDPKLQIGYDPASGNNNPVIIFGVGDGFAVYPEDVTDGEGNIIHHKGDFYETDSLGYPIRWGQAIILKDATGLVFGAAGGDGLCRGVEVRAAAGGGEAPGLWYIYEKYTDDGAKIKLKKLLVTEDE